MAPDPKPNSARLFKAERWLPRWPGLVDGLAELVHATFCAILTAAFRLELLLQPG
jgi:hypothetical protein